MIEVDLFSLLYIQLFSLTITICLRCSLFSSLYSWLLCKKEKKKIRYPEVYEIISESSIQFHCSLCMVLCKYHELLLHSSVVQLEVWDDDTTSSWLIIHDYFSYSGCFMYVLLHATEDCFQFL